MEELNMEELADRLAAQVEALARLDADSAEKYRRMEELAGRLDRLTALAYKRASELETDAAQDAHIRERSIFEGE